MDETYQFALPLVASGQAQKHVTVNEALARLDAVAQMRAVSATTLAPPVSPLDGEAYIVPTGGSWAGQPGEIALWANGAWVYLAPRFGWRVWIEDAAVAAVFDSVAWQSGAIAVAAGGGTTRHEVLEITHTINSATVSAVAAALPGNTVVLGVTARITQAITGTLTTWRLGVQGSNNRYGSGLGLALNSYALGLTGQPLAYYADTDLRLSAEDGNFTGGEVRLAVHLWRIEPPRAV